MSRAITTFLLTIAVGGALAVAQDTDAPLVFKSDVALVRVDAQVLDRDNHAIRGLRREDFVLREDGREQPIRDFAAENMPVDILLLLDVSGSMRPHVQRIADAAQQALNVLGKDDRVGIMVFDSYSRLRMPFRSSRDDVYREMQRLLDQERFNGGTEITGALLDAADYVRHNGRKDARRAIVILTDDQTGGKRDEPSVERALERADAVLSFLQAPDAMSQRGMGRGRYPGGGGGGGYPGSGGSSGPLGGIIFGQPRGGYGGRRQPGGGGYGGGTHSAGTATIARDSGGDVMNVDDASALEDTLSRLRQRYALYFHMPADAQAGEERKITVDLAPAARRRYPDADIRYRRVYLAGTGSGTAGPTMVTHAPADLPPERRSTQSSSISDDDRPTMRRRVAVDEPTGPHVNMGGTDDTGSSSSAKTDPSSTSSDTSTTAAKKPGWRKATDPPPPTPDPKP